MFHKLNKYKAIKTEIDGITFDSKSEARMYQSLKLLEKYKKISKLKLQTEFKLQPGFIGWDGKKVRAITYRADFTFYDEEKKRFRVLDCKGMRTPVFDIKRKMFEYVMRNVGMYIEFEI